MKPPLFAALLAAFLPVSPLCAAMNVWTASDGVKVRPENGKPFGEGVPADYATKSSVWDAASRRITIGAARNETVAFQVLVQAADSALKAVAVQPSDLAGAGILGKGQFRLFREWYTLVDRSSTPLGRYPTMCQGP